MSDERSKISLRSGPKRKKDTRPVISSPKQISNPVLQDPSQINGGPPLRLQPGPPGSGKTSDLVKRRYSTRLGNPQLNFNSGRPPPPTIPRFDQYDASRDRRGLPPPREGPAPVLDVKGLRDPQFNADQFVSSTLSEATEDEVRQYEDSLRQLRARAATDLQQNIYQNRTQFIKISKEAEKLKDEMRQLKNLMTELKTNTNALRSASRRNESTGYDGEFPTGMSKKDRRSSVADRFVLWSTQMQALYKDVEGSQKFLPNAPGRHVVLDAGPWIELDNATYKSRRSIQIFLLNDHFLVASRKKRKTDVPGVEPRGPALKLVADRCWPLLEVDVVDMASTGESSSTTTTTSTSTRSKLADAIMVRGVGQETHIYRTEKPENPVKQTLMLNIRKTVELLRRNLQSEREATNKAKETINYFASRDPGLLQKTDLLETLSDIKDMRIEVDGKQQNLRWVESQMDELDINVALQQIEAAVTGIEKLKALAQGLKNNAIAQDFIAFKIEERCTKLAALIVRKLILSHNLQEKTRQHVSWLTRLGFEDRAREAYLHARSDIIQQRYRECIFQGDLNEYIYEVSFVYFALIRNTVSCFQRCFPTPMMSTCVRWAKERVEEFNLVLARQLSSTKKESSVWKECMAVVQEHAQMLAEVGLDFRNLINADAADAKTP